MSLFNLFSRLKGGSGSGNFGHGGRPGKHGGSTAGTQKIGGKVYMAGDWGSYTNPDAMTKEEKVEFGKYADGVLHTLSKKPAGENPLHPAQFERYVNMKGGQLEINGVVVDKKRILKTKKDTYIDITNGRQQAAIWSAMKSENWRKKKSLPIPEIIGSKKIEHREVFNF